MPQELTKAIVEEWVKQSQGWFNVRDLDRDLDIASPSGKSSRRVILHRLCAEGLIKRKPGQNGIFRLVEEDAPVIEWQDADVTKVIDLRWPFGLERLVSLYPKNLVVIAGTFNAGKTAFCLNLIAMNQHRAEIKDLLPIQYFSSEMGPEEMKVRLLKFPVQDWAFVARERSTNFADVLKPSKLNIIDYLEVTDNFYLVAEELANIFNALTDGIAVVAIQKKRGAEYGRGAEFSLEKPRLYLSMDNNLLKIVKGKNWKVEGQNPNGRKWTFSLVGGWKFTKIEEVL